MAVTSTVLDVTVLLLCVSASVVALGASDTGGPDGPTASDAADRLVTETPTVTYADADAPDGTRRVHATRAELLALITERDADGAFDRRAAESVRTGLGPRTRVDVRVEADEEADGSAAGPAEGGRTPRPVGITGSASQRVTVTRGGASTQAVDVRRRPGSTAESREPVTVGPEPPRNANVAVAVVRQPVPSLTDDGESSRESGDVVRIVVRRW
ncbi:hypothetical protein EKH57_10435 [Halorubrum sp. BOL3-1]|uniref:DUF7284 family protein n=1 Tax=Halorubrum sp. BOL3-1 TaxID=2497325 RepID=UPI00100523BB|nr:hypothetical protein [Halorubrum sp. BOL3-1]QAU13101.1 hypothetical protein EKH57_10435 [Halorubrum sp. BOL3-1]